jgi:hypothetical protein
MTFSFHCWNPATFPLLSQKQNKKKNKVGVEEIDK